MFLNVSPCQPFQLRFIIEQKLISHNVNLHHRSQVAASDQIKSSHAQVCTEKVLSLLDFQKNKKYLTESGVKLVTYLTEGQQRPHAEWDGKILFVKLCCRI